MKINRIWASPNKNTFKIKPIKNLIELYIKNKSTIIDPFANNSKYGTITNDLNKEFDTGYHLDALTFLKMFSFECADLILYDPPYSFCQSEELYKGFGKNTLKSEVTKMDYWSKCKDEISRILKKQGICISFGWNSNGLGLNRGAEILEVLLVCHGGSRNDTIVVVEKKLYSGKLGNIKEFFK